MFRAMKTLTLFTLMAALFAGSVTNATAGEKIQSAEWLANMQAALPSFFCNKKELFMQCFKVKAAECQNAVSDMGQTCADQLKKKMPKKIPAEDNEKWAGDLGYCVGEAYWYHFQDKVKKSKKCKKELNL
jgi:hypothetical protein